MSDIAGAAPAAADSAPAGAPIPTDAPNHSAPLDTQVPQTEAPAEAPAESKATPSLNEALTKANAKFQARQAKEAKPAEDAKHAEPVKAPPEKTAQPRDETTGKFAPAKPAEAAPQQQPAKPTQFVEPPQRFSADAKAAWEAAPEPVRAEIHRAVREMESGLEQHSQFRRAVEPLVQAIQPFAQYIHERGLTPDRAIHALLSAEQTLRTGTPDQKVGMLARLASDYGIDLGAMARGETPQQPPIVAQLLDRIDQLERQQAGVGQIIQQQQQQAQEQAAQQAARAAIDAIASNPQFPRFDELRPHIGEILQVGRAANIEDAYVLAEREHPSHAASNAAAPTPPAPLNPAGQKSVSGAPSLGSNPAARKGPAPSIEESLRRAFAKAS